MPLREGKRLRYRSTAEMLDVVLAVNVLDRFKTSQQSKFEFRSNYQANTQKLKTQQKIWPQLHPSPNLFLSSHEPTFSLLTFLHSKISGFTFQYRRSHSRLSQVYLLTSCLTAGFSGSSSLLPFHRLGNTDKMAYGDYASRRSDYGGYSNG